MDQLPGDWPIWLVALFLLLNLFKEKIFNSVDWLGQDLQDRREHQQKQSALETAYHLSEQAVSQQLMAELVANSQESEREANKYVRDAYTRLLDNYVVLSESVRKHDERIARIEYQIKQNATTTRLLVQIITEIYEHTTGHKAKNLDDS